jgi:ectoine hydroxylase-related dioxygenase (phytanoyl-CoA dioxygenase family)
MPDLNTFPPTATASEIAASVKEHGYAVIHDMLDADGLARLRSELQPYLEATVPGDDAFLGFRTKRFGALMARSEQAREMAQHPLLLALMDELLLPHCARYQINVTDVAHLEPGETAQVMHRDASFYPFQNPAPLTLCATMWAVSEFTRENGATWLVPGSHLWEEGRVPTEDEVVQAEMPAGSMVLYTGTVFHGGGANLSNTMRTGCLLHYSLGWLRQEENQYMACPPELAATFPRRLQELMGYDLAAVNLGFVDHKHPNDLLNGTAGDGPGDLGPQWLMDRDNAIERLKVTGYGQTGRPRIRLDTDKVQGG